jgi:YfiH family protein
VTALNDHPMFQAQWPEGVKSFCSVRHGGASKGPFESLNLGNHVQDDPADVSANRGTFAEHLGAKPVFLNQVHGWSLIELTDQTPDGMAADVCITQFPRLACTIMVADCLPVLLAEPDGQWVAAAHAGWRGLAGNRGFGVMEVAVNAMRERMGSDVAQLQVWLGPCIGPQAFEVGHEVRDAFCGDQAQASQCFQPGPMKGKWWADLPALARMRLQALGVTQIAGNDGSSSWCTVAQQDLFLSHRRDRVSGRFAASIWRDVAA